MRGRDNGLPDYNTVRKCFHLPMINNWTHINTRLAKEKPFIFETLRDLYKDNINDIDL